MCTPQDGHVTLGLSPDLSRDEQVSFLGRLKRPLVFRDAMLMLREIVVLDMRQKKKDRIEFQEWLEKEINRRVLEHEKYLPGLRAELQENMAIMAAERAENEKRIAGLQQLQHEIKKEIDSKDFWRDYYRIERKFWAFLRDRDYDLWFVLDPVITVHPDQVSFEAFSVDESMYGCLSIEMNEFELLAEPQLGTTNIDFSAKLAKEMERFRTYSEVELAVNPAGFTVDTGLMPQHMEKKIDLPESWVKGFNQVSAAANLDGFILSLTPVDMYDICAYLRRHKAKKSPRYMKWILETNQPIRILFEPFQDELMLAAIYRGKKNREEKIWGRRRWLAVEKLIPLANSFQIKLLGFGLPQFIVADMGGMKMTIGLTSWSANDWVKGTAFNIMSGFIGEGNYNQVYALLKKNRFGSIDEICSNLTGSTKTDCISGIGSLFQRGEGYFDVVNNVVRFRKLFQEPIPAHLYQTTPMEYQVKKLNELGLADFHLRFTMDNEFVFGNSYEVPNEKYMKAKYYNTPEYRKEYKTIETKLVIDQDGQIVKLSCGCLEYNRGSRNISAPCAHILSLYMIATKFTRLELIYDKEYKINDIMEILL
jgi:hypothetical protein